MASEDSIRRNHLAAIDAELMLLFSTFNYGLWRRGSVVEVVVAVVSSWWLPFNLLIPF